MIFVMVGTNPYSFDRMVRPLDELAGKYDWDMRMQLGHTDYVPKHCQYDDFISREEVQQYIADSEMIICHGGFGSIRDALAYKKPIVTVPRKPEFNESQDYQEEMVKELEDNGYVLGVYDIEKLESTIAAARNFTPDQSAGSKIPDIIKNFMYG